MTVLLSILCVFFGLITIFLGKEFLKKFRFMADFIKNSNQMVTWHYFNPNNQKPGMRNIVLRGQKPFCALVGFKLDIPILGYSGFDYYGFVRSDSHGVAVISTWLGGSYCQFQFFVNTDQSLNHIAATSSEDDRALMPNASFPPHWYQRLGFYA